MEHNYFEPFLRPHCDIAGQKRTGNNKKWVVFKPEYPESVFKGPYTVGQKTYEVGITRSDILRHWQTPHLVLYDQIIPLAAAGSTQRAVRFPNIMGRLPQNTVFFAEKNGTYSYQVAEWGNEFIKLNKILPESQWVFEQGETLLLALCHLYILHTGDVGMYNIMVVPEKRSIHIIDFEETSGRSTQQDQTVGAGKYFYVTRNPAEKYGLYNGLKPFYNSVADKLEQMTFDDELSARGIPDILTMEEMKLRRDIAVFYLKQYVVPDPPEVQCPRIVVLDTVFPIPDTRIGQMKWTGMRGGNKTFSGFTLSVMKSGIQKYIRRGMERKALLCGIEIYRLREVDGMPGVHNGYHRLAVIANEDIGPARLDIAAYVAGWIVNWVRGTKSFADIPATEDRYDVARYIAIIHTMTRVPKTRIMSHLWRAYTSEPGRKMAISLGLKVDDFNQVLSTETCQTLPQEFFDIQVYKPGDDLQITLVAKIFYNRLLKKDHNAIGWAGYFLETFATKKVAKRFGRFKADVLLWMVISLFTENSVWKPLMDAYYQLTEGRPFLSTAITAILFRDRLGFGTGKVTVDMKEISQKISVNTDIWRQPLTLDFLTEGDYKLEMDSYVLDKHTGKRGDQDKLRKEFVTQGAHIENADPRFADPVLEKIYIES